MEEIEITQRFQGPNQENFEVLCTFQGKERIVKVESPVTTYLRIFFENTKRFSQRRPRETLTMEDWIVKEFVRFASSDGTLKDSMTISTADPRFHRFVYFIQKHQGLGIRSDPT